MYSLKYIEVFFRTKNDADGCGSFAAVERSMSDRLLAFGFREIALIFQFFKIGFRFRLRG